MSEMQSAKLPVWFWIVAVAAIIWTLIGVASYIMDVTMSEEAMAQMSEAERQILEARPTWLFALYAIAVFSALFGAASLALRKNWAVPLFGVSLVVVVVQMAYVLFGLNALATLGMNAAIFPAVIIVIGAFLLWFSMNAKGKGWLK